MSAEFQYDVFLSHSAKDKAVVRPLAERLRADGLKVWFDEWVLKAGDSIPAKIEEGLEHSRVLVLCMSAHAFGSDWAQLESGTFRFRDPLNKERRFIPLRLDDAPIKGSLAQFLYINWLSANRDPECSKLLDACRRPATWPKPLKSEAEDKSAVREMDAKVDQEIRLAFSGLFEPDYISLECLFETYLSKLRSLFPSGPGSVHIPSNMSERTQLKKAILDIPVTIRWPEEIKDLIPRVSEFAETIANQSTVVTARRKSANPNRSTATILRSLFSCKQRLEELLKRLPLRIPWLWLSLLDYSGPFPSSSCSLDRVQRNYLRMASLKLYHSLSVNLLPVHPKLRLSKPYSKERVAAGRWEHNLPLLFEDDDDLVVAYVSAVSGKTIPELCVYGPKGLTLRAYEQSTIEKQAITCRWFSEYFIPQRELLVAEDCPTSETSYREEALIRKVTDLEGRDVSFRSEL